MTEQVPDLEETRRIVLKGPEGYPAKVCLFGSWAHGEARRYSDIDVAISSPEPLPPGLLLEVEEALDQSEVLYPAELVDLTTASESLWERVAAEGIPWNAAAPLRLRFCVERRTEPRA